MKRPALFLDRDGVINVDHGFVHTPEGFQFVDGIFEVVTTANQAGYLVVVVTNQAGIGRSYYSETQFHALTDWMKERFAERGGQIDAVYFSPYHPEHGIGRYKRETDCRKPGPGMLLRAERELDVDMGRSLATKSKGRVPQGARPLLFQPATSTRRSSSPTETACPAPPSAPPA